MSEMWFSAESQQKKENCFLCDRCRIRMTKEYINKSIPNTTSEHNKPYRIKLVLILFTLLLLGSGILGFIYFDLWKKINSMSNPPAQVNAITDAVSIKLTSYEIVEDKITLLPLSGHEYLILSLELSNNSTDNLTLDEMYNFDMYADDIRISYFSDASTVLAELGYESLNGTCAPNQSIQGSLCYELSNSWQKVTLHYSPQVWSSTDIILTLKNTN